MKYIIPNLILLLATLGLVAIARAQQRRGVYAPLVAWWRGASRLMRGLVLALVLTAVAYGSDKILGGHIGEGMRMLGGAVTSLCTNMFTAAERQTGYAASAVRTNETHDLAIPADAQMAERIARRGAHNDGFYFFDAYTNRLAHDGLDLGNPVWVHTDGTVTLRSPAPDVPIQELAQTSVYSNITVYAPLQSSYGFLPASKWPDFMPSLIWIATTDKGSRVVTWEGARLERDVSRPVSFQAEFHENGEVTYRYDTFPTNGVATGVFRNGSALAFDSGAPQNLQEFLGFQDIPGYSALQPADITSLTLSYIGDLGDGSGDTDDDGLTDWEEVKRHHTDPREADTDGDGIPDGEDTDPRDWDADGDGVPDGEDPDDWGDNPTLGDNAGVTNVVISVVKGMARPVRGGNGGGRQSGILEISGVRIPLFQGDSIALSLPTGIYIPYSLHIIDELPVELNIDFLGDGGLWCDKPDLFSGETFSSSTTGRIALPTLSLYMTPSGLSRCVHEHPGYRDFTVALAPMAWDLASASATITGFEQTGGLLRLSVADDPTSVAYGTVTLDAPWLKRGSLEASASIHRCEYDDHSDMCPLCDQGHDGRNHDTSGVNIDIAKNEYCVLRGAVSPVLVSLSGDSDTPADWSISPQDGSAMLLSSPGGEGAYEIGGSSYVWVSAGSNTSYTVTARHTEASDVFDTATVRPVEVSLQLLWETRNKANQIFNPTSKDDDTGNLAVLEKEGDCSYAAPRNNLYVVANPSNDTFDITAHLTVTPSSLADKVVCKAFSNATDIEGSDTELNSEYKAVMEIPSTNTAETVSYSIRAGIEMDGESGISHDETVGLEVYRTTNDVPKYAVLRGITGAQYQWHENELNGKLHALGQNVPSFPCEHARSFLALFMSNGSFQTVAASFRPSSSRVVTLPAFESGIGFSEWLTHNSGADFSEEGIAYIQEYEWEDNSEVAQFLAQRIPLAPKTRISIYDGHTYYIATETGNQLQGFYNAVLRQTAEALLANANPGESIFLPSTNTWYELPLASAPNLLKSLSPTNSPTWVTPSTQVIGQDDGYGGYGALFSSLVTNGSNFEEYDAFGTVGRGRIVSPKFRFKVSKVGHTWPIPDEIKVTAISFSCIIEDLYDFNYEDGILPKHAAALQIGRFKDCSPSRLQGSVFRHKVHINTVYLRPFDYYE